MTPKKYLLASFLLLFLLGGCVTELEQNVDYQQANFIVVDGVLNFSPLPEANDLVVSIGRSESGLIRTIPIKGASVMLLVNGKDSYMLDEKTGGDYYLATENVKKFKKGDTFQLNFQIGTDKYASEMEIMPDSVAIKKTYSELNVAGGANKAFEVFVDVDDPANQKNYYRWKITDWEKQEFCQFCYRANKSPESCSNDLYGSPGIQISRNNRCDGDCYDILTFTPNNSISDIYFDGKPLLKKSIGYVPFVFLGGCLVEIQQNSLTPSYFSFLEKLKSQAENTGGLADTPAALLTGNVSNLNNAKEKIVGFFSITNTSKRRFWLDRATANASGLKSLASLNPPLDPPIPAPALWYPIPCTPSKTRTNIKPIGWK